LNILAIDSSTSVLRIGLAAGDNNIIQRENRDRFRHAEFIFQLINSVISESTLNKSQLEGLIVSTGPGSFTGLRVGLASAKALAIALNIPIVGISTFEAISARLFTEIGQCTVLIPSRRNEYYYGTINSQKFLNENICIKSTDDINNLPADEKCIGIDFEPDKHTFNDDRPIMNGDFSISIIDLITTGTQQFKSPGGQDVNLLQPLYIQNFPAIK
jgi:tRNA threonylcarbamoyl adenosine modification protein YeaZ